MIVDINIIIIIRLTLNLNCLQYKLFTRKNPLKDKLYLYYYISNINVASSILPIVYKSLSKTGKI